MFMINCLDMVEKQLTVVTVNKEIADGCFTASRKYKL